MQVPAVRHSLAVLTDSRQDVAFNQRDPLKVVGEHARREQPGHAPPEDNGMM